MSLSTCAGCTTAYSVELVACPHCGSTDRAEDQPSGLGRPPAFVTLSCACGRGPWQYRLPVVATGLVQLAPLYCTTCGNQVAIPWPPEEDGMPKITSKGGPTNARDAESSPDADASLPLAGAEAGQGHPSFATGGPLPEGAELLPEVPPEAYAEDAEPLPLVKDYEAMTLTELREEAAERGLPSYGTKAQIAERLREADAGE